MGRPGAALRALSKGRADTATMPLTALHPDGSVVDSTACPDEVWARLYRPSSPVGLACRECGTTMFAKVSSNRLRFFQHAPHNDRDCASEGESPEHRELKRAVAELIRQSGATAVIEAAPAPTDTGGWRADVLGIHPNGRRVAFEIQLAGMTIAEGNERTTKYVRDSIDVLWLSTKHARWMSRLPSSHLTRTDTGAFVVDRGLAKLVCGDRWGWEPPRQGPVPLISIVTGMLAGAITTVFQAWFTEPCGDRKLEVEEAVLLVPKLEADRFDARIAEIRRKEEVYQANRQALYDRQSRLLSQAAADALAAKAVVDSVWLGVPPTVWSNAGPASHGDALGNEKTGHGLVIWTGMHDRYLRLWAVVSPVANQCGPELGASWRKRRVRIYVETPREAARIGKAIGWASGEFIVVPPVTRSDQA